MFTLPAAACTRDFLNASVHLSRPVKLGGLKQSAFRSISHICIELLCNAMTLKGNGFLETIGPASFKLKKWASIWIVICKVQKQRFRIGHDERQHPIISYSAVMLFYANHGAFYY